MDEVFSQEEDIELQPEVVNGDRESTPKRTLSDTIEIGTREVEATLVELASFINNNTDEIEDIGDYVNDLLSNIDSYDLRILGESSDSAQIIDVLKYSRDPDIIIGLMHNVLCNESIQQFILERNQGSAAILDLLKFYSEFPSIQEDASEIYSDLTGVHFELITRNTNERVGTYDFLNRDLLARDRALEDIRSIQVEWLPRSTTREGEGVIANYKAIIARNLYFQGLDISEVNVRDEIQRLSNQQEEYGDVNVFADRNVIFVANDEVMSQDLLDRGVVIPQEEIEHPYRFGRAATISTIQEQASEVEFFRPSLGEQTPEYFIELKRQIIKQIESSPPPFTFVFDGHGMMDGIFLAGGDIENLAQLLEQSYFYITPAELGAAITVRYQNFPDLLNNDPSRRDIYIFSSCFSVNFIRILYSELLASGITQLPICISPTEFGQYSITNYDSLYGVDFFETTLGLGSRRPTTLGDVMNNDSSQLDTNPSLYIPEQDTVLQLSENKQNQLVNRDRAA
jgi:hypothetical protein